MVGKNAESRKLKSEMAISVFSGFGTLAPSDLASLSSTPLGIFGYNPSV